MGMNILSRELVLAIADLVEERWLAGDDSLQDLQRELNATRVNNYPVAITVQDLDFDED
jgi:hypothetical protein